jgi:hypothetical protein
MKLTINLMILTVKSLRVNQVSKEGLTDGLEILEIELKRPSWINRRLKFEGESNRWKTK